MNKLEATEEMRLTTFIRRLKEVRECSVNIEHALTSSSTDSDVYLNLVDDLINASRHIESLAYKIYNAAPTFESTEKLGLEEL